MKSDPQPNLLLVVTEQHRRDCLGIANHPVLLTPNMDAIAGAGVRFSRAYSNCPTCIAARRSLLSGQFPPTHGMVGYADGVPWEIEHTVASVLANKGYQTAWVGRSMHQHPADKPFGFECVVRGGADPECDYMKFFRERRPDDSEGLYGTGVMNNDWTARPWHLEEDLHPTNWTVREAMRFLENRDASRPFFLVVSFMAAHPPLLPPAFYMERYLRTGVPDPIIGDWAVPPPNRGLGLDIGGQQVDLRGEALLSARAGYYGLINHIDDQIRRILNPYRGVQKKTGGNTVVMLTSDHGEMLGDHHRWHKIMPYEPSAGIPFLVSAPERFGLQAGAVVDAPVCLADVMPTLLDFAGASIPDTVEGSSLLPLLRGESVPWREFLHLEHAPHYHALTDGREKFVWFVEDGREQYFDMRSDPQELRDLVASPPAQRRVEFWRQRMIEELHGRPEGFSDGRKLIPGRLYPPVMGSGK